MDQEKLRETTLRRKAARLGLTLKKSRRRDPDALDFGLYAIVDPRTNVLLTPATMGQFACSMTLDEIADWLAEEIKPENKTAKKKAVRR